jgi:hypothetical protein
LYKIKINYTNKFANNFFANSVLLLNIFFKNDAKNMVEQSNRISGFILWMDDGPDGIEAFAYRFYV